ncbi:hypothetical protein Pfo_020094 [Paulownia fortunei]|nr:hypothetical protein Pfo_020094 [Paulownia fortunei]
MELEKLCSASSVVQRMMCCSVLGAAQRSLLLLLLVSGTVLSDINVFPSPLGTDKRKLQSLRKTKMLVKVMMARKMMKMRTILMLMTMMRMMIILEMAVMAMMMEILMMGLKLMVMEGVMMTMMMMKMMMMTKRMTMMKMMMATVMKRKTNDHQRRRSEVHLGFFLFQLGACKFYFLGGPIHIIEDDIFSQMPRKEKHRLMDRNYVSLGVLVTMLQPMSNCCLCIILTLFH